MNITEFKVTLSHTYNLGNYSNIKPEITIVAQVDRADDYKGVMGALQHDACKAVYEQIDQHLETLGRPAKFSQKPRYDAYPYKDEGVIVIRPSSDRSEYHQSTYYNGHSSYQGHRFEALVNLCKLDYPHLTILTPQDLIPDMKHVWKVAGNSFVCIGMGQYPEVLPEYLLRCQKVRVSDHFMTWNRFFIESEKEAEEQGKMLVCITDHLNLEALEKVSEVMEYKHEWDNHIFENRRSYSELRSVQQGMYEDDENEDEDDYDENEDDEPDF